MEIWSCKEEAIDLAKKMQLKCTSTEPIMFTQRIMDGDMKKIFFSSSPVNYPF
jgi:hypothetical protein